MRWLGCVRRPDRRAGFRGVMNEADGNDFFADAGSLRRLCAALRESPSLGAREWAPLKLSLEPARLEVLPISTELTRACLS